MSLVLDKSLPVFIPEDKLVHNRVGITDESTEGSLTKDDVFLLHLRRVQNTLLIILNLIGHRDLGLDLQVTLKVVLKLHLLLRKPLLKNDLKLLPPGLGPLEHPLLPPLMINRVKKLPQIEPLNLPVKLIKLTNGHLSMNKIIILFSTKRDLLNTNSLIVTLNSFGTDSSNSPTDPLNLQMLINSILRINQDSIVIIWINKGVSCVLILFKFGGILESCNCHSKRVMKDIVIVAQVVLVCSDHGARIVVILGVLLVSESDEFEDLSAVGTPL